MNLIDNYVTEILGKPYYQFNKYWLQVMADGYGRISEHTLMFNTLKEVESVTIGYKFLA